MTQGKHPVIGVGGGSGVGKSTLVQRFHNASPIPSTTFPIDAYYRDLSHIPKDERGSVNFDHPDAIENELLIQHLETLRSGDAIHLPEYSYESHTRVGETQLVPKGIILVEGSLLFAIPGLLPRLDLVFFLDLPESERKNRRWKRDKAARGRSRAFFDTQYEQFVVPMHEQFIEPFCSDETIRLDASNPTDALVDKMNEHLRTSVRLAHAIPDAL